MDRVAGAFRMSIAVAALCGLISFASIAFGAKEIVSMLYEISKCFDKRRADFPEEVSPCEKM